MAEGILTRMTKGCLAEEFEERIGGDVFGAIPAEYYRADVQKAKFQLQELYHRYRRNNPCRASAFAGMHRCVHQVYIDAYERLDTMDRYAKVDRPRVGEQSKLSAEEALAAQIFGLRARILGDDTAE